MALLSSDLEQPAAPVDPESEQEHTAFQKHYHDRAPAHPIPQLQGPFEESMLEAIEGAQSEWVVELDARSRRRDLLESAEYERLCGRKWRQRASERYHPFWKLISQMSFGIGLLTKRLAKSDVEVLRILQAHVDEMDGFLGRTMDDFLIIQADVRTRIQYLSLPLGNLEVFDQMLDDRQFRCAMIRYNEKIEHAVERFTQAVKDSLKDIQKGKAAVGALWQYLGDSARQNAPLSNNTAAIYNAMLANTEGWNVAFSELRRKGVAIESALLELGLTITEMQRRVGVASRKEVVSFMGPSNSPLGGKRLRDRLFERASIGARPPPVPEKPLPCDPGLPEITTPTPLPRQADRRQMVQKSAPNLRAAKELHKASHCHDKGPPGRAKSVNGSAGNANHAVTVWNLGRSGSRFSKFRTTPKFEDRQVEGNNRAAPTRPATAPSKTLRARSTSTEQLKAFCKCSKDQGRNAAVPQALSALREPLTAPVSTRRDTMKEQLLQYFKGGRVMDTWENQPPREKIAGRNCRQKGDLWSRFRAKSTNSPGIFEDQSTNLFDDDLGQQMAWLQQERESLKTYSLKPRRDVDPRIHVLSVHVGLTQELEGGGGSRTQDDIEPLEEDTQSAITALPSVHSPGPRAPSLARLSFRA